MLSKQEIEKRKPLWQSFSDYWLDNELQNYDFEHTVNLMISSGYLLGELEKIFSQEVAPVVYTNLYSPAGEWAGFDSDWLYAEIIEDLEKQENNTLYRAWAKSDLRKHIVTSMVREDWNKTIEMYKSYSKTI